MKNFLILFLTMVFCAVPIFVFADSFTRNLFLGIVGPDVKLLQQFLNKDVETRIAENGDGSVGNETEYFGSLTELAVKKFQLKHADEILKPVGLSVATGFVGLSTRVVLNKLAENFKDISKEEKKVADTKKSTSTNTKIATFADSDIVAKTKDDFYAITDKQKKEISDFTGIKYNKNDFNFSNISSNFLKSIPFFTKTVQLYNTEPFQAKSGSKITVNGVGFAKKNNVFTIDGKRTVGVDCQSNTYCQFNLPDGLSNGIKSVYLENENGSSQNQKYTAAVNIVDNPKLPSQITVISPERLTFDKLDQKIVLSGEGFASENNYVNVPMGRVGPLNSNGKEIIFSLKDIKELNDFIPKFQKAKAKNIMLPIMVENEYGTSNFTSIMLE